MQDNASVEVAVATRIALVPEVHLHSGPFTVGRSAKVGVVDRAAVLCLGKHVVATEATVAIVVFLEISTRLVEAVLILNIMHQIVPVEEVGDGAAGVGERILGREVDREVEVAI